MSVIVAQRPVSIGHIVGVVFGAAVFAAVPQTQAGLLAVAAVVVGAITWALHTRARFHLTRADATSRSRRARRVAARHARVGNRLRLAMQSMLMTSLVLGTAGVLRLLLNTVGVA